MQTSTPRYTGARIGDVLAVQGRRQDWLAEQIGMSRARLNMAMKGRRSLSVADAERIAIVLGVPFSMLFESPIGDIPSPKQSGVRGPL